MESCKNLNTQTAVVVAKGHLLAVGFKIAGNIKIIVRDTIKLRYKVKVKLKLWLGQWSG